MILRFVCLFAFSGLCAEGPQMTVIFKHLRGRGDSPSSRPRNQGMASGKALTTVEGCVTSSIPALSAGDQGLYPRGARRRLPSGQKKGTEGRTLVMDKPVVSAFGGQFRDVGLRWGGKMIDSSLGASSTPRGSDL